MIASTKAPGPNAGAPPFRLHRACLVDVLSQAYLSPEAELAAINDQIDNRCADIALLSEHEEEHQQEHKEEVRRMREVRFELAAQVLHIADRGLLPLTGHSTPVGLLGARWIGKPVCEGNMLDYLRVARHIPDKTLYSGRAGIKLLGDVAKVGETAQSKGVPIGHCKSLDLLCGVILAGTGHAAVRRGAKAAVVALKQGVPDDEALLRATEAIEERGRRIRDEDVGGGVIEAIAGQIRQVVPVIQSLALAVQNLAAQIQAGGRAVWDPRAGQGPSEQERRDLVRENVDGPAKPAAPAPASAPEKPVLESEKPVLESEKPVLESEKAVSPKPGVAGHGHPGIQRSEPSGLPEAARPVLRVSGRPVPVHRRAAGWGSLHRLHPGQRPALPGPGLPYVPAPHRHLGLRRDDRGGVAGRGRRDDRAAQSGPTRPGECRGVGRQGELY